MNLLKEETRYTDLRTRMDKTMSRYYLDAYIMKDSKTKNPIEGVSNITLNDPRTFADRYMSIMGQDKRCIEITGVDPAVQKKIEEWLKLAFYKNDQHLHGQLIEPLETCFNFFAGLRGWVGFLALCCRDGKKYQPLIQPLDPRWMMWEVGRTGLKWASHVVRMQAAAANEMYGLSLPAGEYDIHIVWNDKNFTIYKTNIAAGIHTAQELKVFPHKLGFCPIGIMPVPTQPMLIGSTGFDFAKALSYQGEDIYAANRAVYDDLNEAASVWATINKMQFLSPLVYKGNKLRFEQQPFGPGVVIQIDPTESIEQLFTKEMTVSAQALVGVLVAKAQKGSMSDINYGALSFQLAASAVAQLKDDRDQVIQPRRKVKSTAFQAIINMLARQIKKGSYYETDVFEEDSMEIDSKIFQNPFTATVTYNSISPEENIVNYQLAIQARSVGRPDTAIRRDILKVDNPEEDEREGKLQRAYAMIPQLEMFDMAIQLAPGDMSEKPINEMKAKIILWAIKQQIQMNQNAIANVPNVASQPKVPVDVNRPAAQRLAEQEVERMGVAAQRQGKQARGE